jgi:hypothetical protein
VKGSGKFCMYLQHHHIVIDIWRMNSYFPFTASLVNLQVRLSILRFITAGIEHEGEFSFDV